MKISKFKSIEKRRGGRPLDAEGIIVLSASTGFVSNAIRWITKSQFSHASLLIAEKHNTFIKFEAQSRGVILYTLEEDINNYLLFIRMNVPKKNIIKASIKTLELEGKRYLFENFIGFGVSITANNFFEKLGINIKTKNFMTNGYWCSKLVQYYINEVLKQELGDPDNCTPENLNILIQKRPDIFEIIGRKDFGSDTIVWG